jgi:hypothetical protein
MSRSKPTKARAHEPYQAVPEARRYYIGRDKAQINVSVQQPDRYSYDRWKASRKLGLPEWELADEPDTDIYNLREKEDYGR